MTSDSLCIFVATWEKMFGVKIIEKLPKTSDVDLQYTTMKIFVAYENFYDADDEKKQERIFFRFPLKDLDRKARILLDRIDKGDKSLLFIVCLIYPDFFSDDTMDEFDKLLGGIASEYRSDGILPSFKKYYNDIDELFEVQQKVQDKDYSIENYSTQDGLLDFKKGIEYFSAKKLDQAYFLIRKAHLRFEADNNVKLLLESSYLLGTILSQLNKYNAALTFYDKLEKLAEQLQHQKYLETSIFMGGFCAFKSDSLNESLNKFMKLAEMNLQFIDKFNFYFLFGRVLKVLGINDVALKNLKIALEIGKEKLQSLADVAARKSIQERQGRLLLEIGHVSYALALNTIKKGMLEGEGLKGILEKSLKYYREAIALWKELENYPMLIYSYQLIANILEILNDTNGAIEEYRNALHYAEFSNDILSRFKLFKKIIQNLVLLKEHLILVKEIDEMLSKIVTFAFVDLFTIADYHRILGASLYELGQEKDALSELLIALNIYNKFDRPVEESVNTLEEIIKIYQVSGEEKYIHYYSDQLEQVKKNLLESNEKEKNSAKISDTLSEFWIFHNEGVEIFAHAIESKLDPQLFGGFISAIQMFSKELTKEEIQSVTIGLDKYLFFNDPNVPFYIVGRTRTNISEVLIIGALKTLFYEFWNDYKSDIENYDPEITKFEGFVEKIEELRVKY